MSMYDHLIARFEYYHHKLPELVLSSLPLKNVHVHIGTRDGNKYVYFGEMVKGSTSKKNGRGMKIYENGNIMIGHFNGDWMDGKARVVLNYGEILQAEFKGGLINGKGIQYLASGSMYEGEWKEGRMHGEFRIVCFNGKEWKKKFENGKEVMSS
jgi:hypothetical protein